MNTPKTADGVAVGSTDRFAPFDADGILCVQDGKITTDPDEERDWAEYHIEHMHGDVWRIEVCPSENTGWDVFRGKLPTREFFVTVMQNIDEAPPIDWANDALCRPAGNGDGAQKES
jgi:hypothetical protein